MQKGRILWNIRNLPGEYRKRWGIETGYRDIERVRAKTTSSNNSIRVLYFMYSLLLYNAWLLANLIISRRFSIYFKKPAIELAVMAAYFGVLLKASEIPDG